MDAGFISLVSSLGVAALAGFWTWLQARESRKGEESRHETDAALRMNERLMDNLQASDARAKDFMLEANTLREQLNALRDDLDKTSAETSELSAKITMLQRKIASADHLLLVAMNHINDLRLDISTTYVGVALRPLPRELEEFGHG